MSEERKRVVEVQHCFNAKGKPLFTTNKICTTKYNVLTFLPKNLFFQFSRIANFYFLIVVCLLQFPWAPISAAAAVVPLVIVIGITAIREAVEDILRYRSDQRINSSEATRLINGKFETARWDSILVGDIIRIHRDEQIPADVVLLSTDEQDGTAYIDTCNLDGETNLKVRQAIPQTLHINSEESSSTFESTIECDEPNKLLYTFNGNIIINESQHPLDNKQILLRGCILKNTQWAIGVVVYTGKESKIMMNSNKARAKRSKIERGLNMKLISMFIFIIFFSFLGATIGFLFEKNKINSGEHWYFFRNENNKRNLTSLFFILLVSSFVVINATIPISLYVTLEIVRVFQALFVNCDVEMYDPELKTFANSRTTNISDDLGQVEYVFSDKTGTLTRNVMEFMQCSIGGIKYGTGTTEVAYAAAKRQGIKLDPPNKSGKAFKDEKFFGMLKSGNVPDEVSHFLWLLSCCHAVIPEKDETKEYGIAFQASSPDEGALVEAAAYLGYLFKNRRPEEIVISINGEDVTVPILANLEFTSERKRSSVIIRNPITNQIILYCKGADDLILSRLSKDSQYIDETKLHLKEFSANGLRTLCCAYRIIDEDFFRDWIKRYNDANCTIVNRDEVVNNVCNEIESELFLLGATAIEDKLQEGVPDTIESLLKAHINVWIITGDKRETAINIGYACSLLSGDMKLIVLDTTNVNELISIIDRFLTDEENDKQLALIASGAALELLLTDEHKDKFYQISLKCQSVICCRVSPSQKASIVKIMMEKTGKLSLSIGDGANDVAMIMQADVGIGISGKEGRQAVLASDYSISQFRYLKRLLLVHGRINFYRNIDLINYSFYKNMAFSLNNILFGFFSSNSGNTVFDSMLYTVFNVIYTSVPPVVYAGLERDVPLDSMMKIPSLYYFDGKREYMQSYLRFWLNILLGVFHALCSFFVAYFSMYPFVGYNGQQIGLKEFGITIYGSVVTVVNLRIALMCSYWTWLHHLFVWLSILIYPATAIIIDLMKLSDDMVGITIPLMRNGMYWFVIIATSILAMIPVIIIRTIESSRDNLANRVRYIKNYNDDTVDTSEEKELLD
ncbi:P-type ATPase [Histomonas meleagridis]|uniref:P-type ATPase n=1 Tax=Histomonas meleagridis TaxID=135588 RepID=UPI00355AC69C|nr:P-type ATPase [Histomonas meleagridis]KAH0802629.1 P-type ATPase [Histomonas meleagridis]